jgi:hypothetical protein
MTTKVKKPAESLLVLSYDDTANLLVPAFSAGLIFDGCDIFDHLRTERFDGAMIFYAIFCIRIEKVRMQTNR